MNVVNVIWLTLLCGMLGAWAIQKDAFVTLGVRKSASDKEIKAAYRKLSLQYHPDKSPNTQDKFIEISEAYEQIGDDKSRRNYLQNLAMEGQRSGGTHSFTRRGGQRRHAHADDIFAAFEQQFAEEFGQSRGHRGRGREYRYRSRGGEGRFYSFSYSGFSDHGEAESFPSIFDMIWSVGSLLFVPFLTTIGPVIMLIIYCFCFPTGREEGTDRRQKGSSKGSDHTNRGVEGGVNKDPGRIPSMSQQLPELQDFEVPKGMIVVASLDQYSMELLLLVLPHFQNDTNLLFKRCESNVPPMEGTEENKKDDDQVTEETYEEKKGPHFRGISVCSRGHAFFTGLSHDSDEEAVASVVMWIERLVSGDVTWKSNDDLDFVDSECESEVELEEEDEE